MHGRIKTISSEEQNERQRKAREIKCAAYTKAMSHIFTKREQGEYDDEALTLTRDILLSNPNINTLWNYRRQVLLCYKNVMEEAIWEQMLVSDLSLTEVCLRSDPKSYCAWHHRLWLLESLPTKAWDKELKLCNKMLALDERNFHCWDYRKIVVERAQVATKDEYDFTTSKIESNFSNYSAWHFRSKLLPKLFDDPTGRYLLEESKHKEELELVQNAAFTDPDDQSAWFYQRWLLNLRAPSVAFVWAQATRQEVTVAFSRSLCSVDVQNVNIRRNNTSLDGNWTPLSGNKSSTIWTYTYISQVNEEDNIEVSLDDNQKEVINIKCNRNATKQPNLLPSNSTHLKETLEEQLLSCRQLLELEPDSKWTMLTSALLMRCLSLDQNIDAILSALKKLAQSDPLRNGYYTDLASQVRMELKLINDPFTEHFCLSKSNLSCLYYTQYISLAKSVDLSDNQLSECDLKHLYSLVSCTELNLDGNKIRSVSMLPQLDKLTVLSLRRNPIVSCDTDRQYLKHFPSLQVARFTE